MLYRATCTGLTLVIVLAACSQPATESSAAALTTTQATTLKAEATPQPVINHAVSDEEIKFLPPAQSFNAWLADFKDYALKKGVSSEVFEQAFKGVTPDKDVIKADYSQPEFTRPVWEYLNTAVSATRISNGEKKIAEHKATLDELERFYQVDQQVMVSIWGMESGYGAFTGNKNVIRSLATLAYEGRRISFAREQLIAALKILENGDVKSNDMLGSWAGAMGQTQFIPTTYLAMAVDFDKDGHRNIWTSVPDALASTANYLKSSGWQHKETWGHEVKLPSNFNYYQTDISTKKSVAQWSAQGVRLVNGQPIPVAENNLQAAIILPAGAHGPAFIVYRNFFAIMKYNNSTAYALAVSLLMDNLKGKSGKVVASWPVADKPLSRSERKQLQRLLNQQGYSAGYADGIIGGNTRQAIRSYQQQLGVPADGYPSHQLLNELKGL